MDRAPTMHLTSIKISPICLTFASSFLGFDLLMGVAETDCLHEKASEWGCHCGDCECGGSWVVREESQVVLGVWQVKMILVGKEN